MAKRYYGTDLQFENAPVRAMFITSGGFYEDSESYLSQLSEGALKPLDLALYYDGNRLIGALDKYGFKHDAGIIRRFYQRKPKDLGE